MAIVMLSAASFSAATEVGGVIAGALSAEVTRADVDGVVLDGFFPVVGADARPRRASGAGLREWGLPFAADAEITREDADAFGLRSQQNGARAWGEKRSAVAAARAAEGESDGAALTRVFPAAMAAKIAEQKDQVVAAWSEDHPTKSYRVTKGFVKGDRALLDQRRAWVRFGIAFGHLRHDV